MAADLACIVGVHEVDLLNSSFSDPLTSTDSITTELIRRASLKIARIERVVAWSRHCRQTQPRQQAMASTNNSASTGRGAAEEPEREPEPGDSVSSSSTYIERMEYSW